MPVSHRVYQSVSPSIPDAGPFRQNALFFLRSELTLPGRVKAEPQIETWQRRSAAAFTPAVILFIELPETESETDPG
jgi:hypothetical protein